jgi:predicted AAA+ superfamily ATPase
VAVSKDTLHEYLAHLEDAFLIRTLSLHTSSERQRKVNPRKAHPVNPGLIPIYERSGRPNWGHALETAVFLELERRGYEMGYVRTAQGFEVDFLAGSPGERLSWSRCARMSRIHRRMTARCEPWQRRRVNIGAPVPCSSPSNRPLRRLACRLP